jgi:membrane protein involved in colicin uptake
MLGELRGLEVTRQRTELEASRRATEARLAAERDAVAARRRDAEETERRIADEARAVALRAEAEARAERLVAIEAEARARAAAEIALAAERQAQELAIHRELVQRTRPRLFVAALGVVGAIALALAVAMIQRGAALDDAHGDATTARAQAAAMSDDLAATRARVARLEEQLARAPHTPPVTTSTPPVITKPGGKGKGGKGGKGGTAGETGGTAPPPIDLSDRCVADPLGAGCARP